MDRCPVCGAKVKQKEGFWKGNNLLDYYNISFLCGSRYKVDGEKTKELVKCRWL